MNFCRSTGLFRYSTILLFTLSFNGIAADRCIYDSKRILTDLMEEGKNLLKFNYSKNSPTSVLDIIMSFINEGDINLEYIVSKLEPNIFEQIVKRSTKLIEKIKSENNGGKNSCAEVLKLCDLGISVGPNTDVVETKVIPWNQRNVCVIISPLYLVQESLVNVLPKIYETLEEITKEETVIPDNVVQEAYMRNELSAIIHTNEHYRNKQNIFRRFSVN